MQDTQDGWFGLWVGKIPRSRKWQPTPAFLHGEFRRRVGHDRATEHMRVFTAGKLGNAENQATPLPPPENQWLDIHQHAVGIWQWAPLAPPPWSWHSDVTTLQGPHRSRVSVAACPGAGSAGMAG